MDSTLLLLFVETPIFSKRWAAFGLTDFDISILQWSIMENPKAGAVISGAGGFRKMRFAPLRSGRGKSGAFRVIYLPMPRQRTVVLGVVFSKSDASNINAADKHDLIRLAGVYEFILSGFFRGAKS